MHFNTVTYALENTQLDETFSILMRESLSLVDKAEPENETPEGKKLFPDAHEGNVRRVIQFAFTHPAFKDISDSTRLWMTASVLLDHSVMDDKERYFKKLSRYLKNILGIPIKYNHRRVRRYWKNNYPRTWHPHKNIGRPPRNAAHVLEFRTFLCTMIEKDGNTDSRLWLFRTA